MDDYNLHFEGIFPSHEEQVKFQNFLTILLDEAPANSFLNAKISKNGTLLKGQIRINSNSGSFFAAGAGRDLEDLGQQLVIRMRQRLAFWKAHRFENPTLSA